MLARETLQVRDVNPAGGAGAEAGGLAATAAADADKDAHAAAVAAVTHTHAAAAERTFEQDSRGGGDPRSCPAPLSSRSVPRGDNVVKVDAVAAAGVPSPPSLDERHYGGNLHGCRQRRQQPQTSSEQQGNDEHPRSSGGGASGGTGASGGSASGGGASGGGASGGGDAGAGAGEARGIKRPR